MASVSWRRDSAEERFVMEVARSRRRRAVAESIESRSGSVRVVCWAGGDVVVGEVGRCLLGPRRGGAPVVER